MDPSQNQQARHNHHQQPHDLNPGPYPFYHQDDSSYALSYPHHQIAYQIPLQQNTPLPPPDMQAALQLRLQQQQQQHHSHYQQVPQQQQSASIVYPPLAASPPPPSPTAYDPLSPPVSGSDTSEHGHGDPYYHSRHSSVSSAASTKSTSVRHNPLRYTTLTPSPTGSSQGRGRRAKAASAQGGNQSNNDDLSDDGAGSGDNPVLNSMTFHPLPPPENLANTRKEMTRRQRIEAEQRRRDELRECYARLKNALPSTNQKSSKVSLLERATAYIIQVEKTNKQMQTRLSTLEQEVARLRGLNEKIAVGTTQSPSPAMSSDELNSVSRPLSPPPDIALPTLLPNGMNPGNVPEVHHELVPAPRHAAEFAESPMSDDSM